MQINTMYLKLQLFVRIASLMPLVDFGLKFDEYLLNLTGFGV